MNELQRSTPGVICLVDDNVDRRALVYAISVRLGLRFECDENLKAFGSQIPLARPACLLVADHLLPLGTARIAGNQSRGQLAPRHDFAGNNLATIVLASQPEVDAVVDYMRAGAVTVLADPLDPDTLAHWIHEALRVDQQRFQDYCRGQEFAKTYSQFSRRKQLVLRHMIEGRASKWSAHDLDVSRRTIELDRADILSAFRASNAIELARAVGPWLDQQPWESPHARPVPAGATE